MKNRYLPEIGISVLLVILSFFLINPFALWMADSVHMSILVGFIALVAVFSAFIFREHPTDEREVSHQALAGRIAFFVGSAALILGILYKTFYGPFDSWLVVALLLMVLAKVGTRVYCDSFR